MPLTYSVASLLIVSRAFWYSFIFSCIPFPIIDIIHAKPMTAGIMHISPIFQLNANISTISPAGVTAATVLSGSWCAIKVSVAAVESFTIRLILPVPSSSNTPSGSVMILLIRALLMLACTRKAAICVHSSAAI